MILPPTKYTDSIWKSKFKNISQISPEIKKLVKDMRETLDITSGVGLAAPQVDKPFRMFVVDYARLRETFINPKILRYGKEANLVEEGCLSVPCKRGLVSRPTEVEIEFLDLKGVRKRITLRGYYARIIQHEYDHLSSKFYVDKITNEKYIYTYPPIKIVYLSSSEFGVITLKTIYGQSLVGEMDLQLVVTNSDKSSGRGKEFTSNIIKTQAKEFQLPIETPTKLKEDKEIAKKIKALNPDFLVVASYGQILPKEILDIPKKGAINVHPSLLPKYRGATPIQTAIKNGDKTTGVTIMKMNEKMDAGDILASAGTKISAKDTYESLSKKLSKLGAELLLHVLHLQYQGKLKPKPQAHSRATYTKVLTKESGKIDWKKPPKNLNNIVRAYHPWPGVWTYYQPAGSSKQQAKKILKLLPNNMVQLEGKQPVGLKEFKSGHKDFNLNW